ncbi:MAG: PIN domain-containing protein [Candidatus Lokiarchaeota archaeon]|nr:PIN domain-containing protein [Candidatus Lokiarchaeota archaeon]MBD3201202.1 PIN domain-containing protein [Candidatus Lokiarchaeota archaeon]
MRINGMGVFLDTGFLIGLKNKEDKNFDQAQLWMKRFLKNEFGEIYTSTYIFDEVVTLALVRLKNIDFAKDIGKYILSSPRIHLIEITIIDFENSWKLFKKFSNNRLSFTDCSILVLYKRLKCKFLGTFDSHFKGLVPTNIS